MIFKRIFDYSLALFGLFIFSPLWLIFTLTIWLEDKGPVYYTQDRVGKNSKLFKGIKFRSMKSNAEEGVGPIQAKENDPRVTKIGRFLRKTAMDELPQLLNILKGDMSFVGPRALRLVERESRDNVTKSIFDFPDFDLRSKLRPGLTGVAQVFGARDLIRQEKFKYDIWYIRNQNFLLDLYIIILSFFVSLRARWETREDKFRLLGRYLKQKIEKDIGDFY
jgi:lipopolysaccharide/colanic/teichoic acid biosynthesis glycosyltransferase